MNNKIRNIVIQVLTMLKLNTILIIGKQQRDMKSAPALGPIPFLHKRRVEDSPEFCRLGSDELPLDLVGFLLLNHLLICLSYFIW